MFKAAKFRFVFACLRSAHVYPGKILSFAHPRKKKLSPHEKSQVTDNLRLVGRYGWTYIVGKEIVFGFFIVFYSTASGLLQTFCALLSSFNSLYFSFTFLSLFLHIATVANLPCQFALRAKYRTPAHVAPTSLYYVYPIPLVAWFYIFHSICSKLVNSQTRVKIPKAGTARNKFFASPGRDMVQSLIRAKGMENRK